MSNFDWCKKAYDNHWATETQLQTWVSLNRLTPQEYFTITGDTLFLKTLVVDGKITTEEYKTITGIDYVV
ncbi:XkdX family protein [Clostridium magnum]|uniref:XkdX family protein n=1 Tax=Clostridium magnum DSM 2767 TaxID=1121326 RepID=A0A161YRH3_9CLOT|nr:XkdX family protein [Clostridium magnum]KZL93572.1 hypothetical protein CLMAG_06180 [Clostridium magnum DSM 2767]SHI59839.1 Phage uncharacterised protein (Phage_XkdX) [Clostridium magnum DSM 2767]